MIGWVGWLILLLAAGCSSNGKVASGDLAASVDGGMRLSVTALQADAPLLEAEAAFSGIRVAGQTPDFTLVRTEKKKVNDAFGEGTAYIFHGEARLGEGKIKEALTLTTYGRFPSTVIARAAFTNATGAPLAVEGWTMDRFNVIAGEPEPAFWRPSTTTRSPARRPEVMT